MTDPQQDIATLSTILTTIAGDLLEGRGFAIPVTSVLGAVGAGKRLAGKPNAGKQVMKELLGAILRDHPEVIDLAFAGLSEAAKNKIRKALDAPEIKEAERV